MNELLTTTGNRICVMCRSEYDGAEAACPDDGSILVDVSNNARVDTIFDGSYLINEVLGFGATSIVYKATHLRLNRLFALKILHPHLVSDGQVLLRFEREARAAGSLDHENVIAVYQSGVSDDGCAYFVMEYLQGETLEVILDERGYLPVERAVKLFLQLASGLGEAHSHGILHRDIKPSNIFINTNDDDEDQAKLLDFGVAKLLTSSEQTDPQLSRAGEICGTPTALSPEQCLAKPLDQRSDIYALGCLMYETLSGAPPLLGDSVLETMQKHVSDKAQDFDELVPELHIPWALAGIVFRCLEKDPADRYQSADDVAQALRALSV